MIKYPSHEAIPVIEEVLNALVDQAGLPAGKLTRIIGVRVCDHCQDVDEEAFPYYVTDAQGREWAHLCNECFDELGCAYAVDDES